MDPECPMLGSDNKIYRFLIQNIFLSVFDTKFFFF